MILKTR